LIYFSWGKDLKEMNLVNYVKMVEGTVKFFNRTRNYGFINGDDGETYFVHGTGLKEGVEIDEGDRVSFKATKGDKGPKAEDVEKLEEKGK
jgi:CspA family cold shock protein